MIPDLEGWLRQNCAEYRFDVRGVFRGSSSCSSWPLHAGSPELLEAALVAGGHLLPLPKEPAALANILEVSIVDFLLSRLATVPGAEAVRGSERGYPDLEIFGSAFGDRYHAVDVKAARRAVGGLRTQSRITLYTGNTYFKWPHLRWPGTFRPFEEYAVHLDVIAIYTLEINAAARVADLEIIVQQPWRVASRKRSSTTREYIGAVDVIEQLRSGQGEFGAPEDFYRFWRSYSFRVSKQVQLQLDRLVREQREEIERLRRPGVPGE